MDTLEHSVNQSPLQTEKISISEKIFYGGGDLASNLVLVLTSTYVTFFYTEALKLDAGIIGMIIMLSRLLDGISDILMGFVMDKTKSKYGKARPWMLWLAIPIAVATILVFAVPNLGDLGKYIYIAITYNIVTTILYTAINIPYGALTSLLSRDQNERMIINIFRMFMAQVGSLMINALTLPFVNAMGGSSNQRSWIIVSCIYGALAAVLFLLCFAKTRERVDLVREKVPFGKSFKIIMKNNYWLLLCAVWIVMVLGLAMSGSVAAYYAKYVLQNENYSGFLAAAGILPALIAMPLLAPLIQKYGKRNIALVGSIISLGAQCLILVSPESFSWLLMCSLIKGAAGAAAMGTMFAMIADTIEYGHWKTGTRVEGMLYSTTTFGAKVGGGIGAAVAMGVLSAAGYVGDAAVQVPATMQALRTLYLYVPIPFLAVLPVIYYLYKLDKIYPQVMAELAEREANGQQ